MLNEVDENDEVCDPLFYALFLCITGKVYINEKKRKEKTFTLKHVYTLYFRFLQVNSLYCKYTFLEKFL